MYSHRPHRWEQGGGGGLGWQKHHGNQHSYAFLPWREKALSFLELRGSWGTPCWWIFSTEQPPSPGKLSQRRLSLVDDYKRKHVSCWRQLLLAGKSQSTVCIPLVEGIGTVTSGDGRQHRSSQLQRPNPLAASLTSSFRLPVFSEHNTLNRSEEGKELQESICFHTVRLQKQWGCLLSHDRNLYKQMEAFLKSSEPWEAIPNNPYASKYFVFSSLGDIFRTLSQVTQKVCWWLYSSILCQAWKSYLTWLLASLTSHPVFQTWLLIILLPIKGAGFTIIRIHKKTVPYVLIKNTFPKCSQQQPVTAQQAQPCLGQVMLNPKDAVR